MHNLIRTAWALFALAGSAVAPAARADATNVMSEVVSYQYHESPGESVLLPLSSPVASYLFQQAVPFNPSIVPPANTQGAMVLTAMIHTDPGESIFVEFKEALTDPYWRLVRIIGGDGQTKAINQAVESSAPSGFCRARTMNEGFLSFPIAARTPYTAPISAVVDFSGTPLDGRSTHWYERDDKVAAFTGEVGERQFGVSCTTLDFQPGYRAEIPQPFLNGIVIYIGATCADVPMNEDVNIHPNHYLNYDGHPGYDYPFPHNTEVIAPASGILRKAITDSVNGPRVADGKTAWEKWHTFYIDHGNGKTTWYLHCDRFSDSVSNDVEAQGYSNVTEGTVIAYVGSYMGVPPHLHFEVRNGIHEVVDPYHQSLWKTLPPAVLIGP